MIDSHCHLYLKELVTDLSNVLERAAENGVTDVICPGLDLETSEKCVAIATNHKSVFATVGIHPNYSGDLPDDYLDSLRLLTLEKKVVAIGEIGLDYFRNYSTPDHQQVIFREQLQLALELDLPVIIHNRNADSNLMAILKESGVRHGVAHCFSGGIQLAKQFLKLGFYISFAGNLTYKNSDLPVVAQTIPLDRLLVETDAPFLSPVPFRGKLNEPGRTRYVALKLAAIKGMELNELAVVIRRNTEELFGLKK